MTLFWVKEVDSKNFSKGSSESISNMCKKISSVANDTCTDKTICR
jgi:hypothetical protein